MPPVVSLWDRHQYIYKHRNYYGIYKIYEGNEKRFFLNGTTLHGAQYILEKRDTEPLTYYHPSTPIGKFLKSGLFNYQRIGVIGLGAGSLAAYNKEDQAMDFFELDPEVFTIAKKYFAFLNKSHGKINIVFGDARLTLDKVPQNYYDVLIVDAFSGDAVPVHLLTTEAISEYRKHLTEKGVIVFHISNRYLDLSPVLFSNAIALHSYVCRGYNRGFALGAYPSFWVALTWDSGNFEKLTSELKWSKSAKYGTEWLWTDQYSNIISTFKFDSLVSQIKEFQPFYWNFNFDQAAMDEWEYYLAQGDSYSSKGDFKEAINYYHKAVAIKQDRPQPYIGLGRVYENLNRYQEAKASYQKAIDIDSDIADVYFYLGKTCTELGQYQEAMVNYKKAIAINYEYYDAYYNLGVVYICLGQYAEATKILQKVIKLNPDSCFSKSLHDILVLRKEEFINHQKAIETNSTNAQAYFSLGKIYAELGIYRQAITNYEKAISINPDYAEAYSELGAIYAVINKHPEAKDYLIKAKEMFERRKDTEKSKEIGELIEKIL
jgi:tetratricopeptide (TPR) repeat protein